MSDAENQIVSEAITRAFTEAYELGKASARAFPKLEIYRWVCPWCKGGTDPDQSCSAGCLHCGGATLTNDVAGWDPAELTPAPLPAALMPAPCGDCAYREGSPELERTGSVTLPGEEGNAGPFFCHLGMSGDNTRGYHATAWIGELPLGAMLCRGWWNKIAGAPAPTRPYRDRHPGREEEPHRCDDECSTCPACGSAMVYAFPTPARTGEHGCVNSSCVFSAGEHAAMGSWMPPFGRRGLTPLEGEPDTEGPPDELRPAADTSRPAEHPDLG